MNVEEWGHLTFEENTLKCKFAFQPQVVLFPKVFFKWINHLSFENFKKQPEVTKKDANLKIIFFLTRQIHQVTAK